MKKLSSEHSKEIIKKVQDQVNNGKPKQDILDDLSKEYFDISFLSKIIAHTADQKTKFKYRKLNNLLVGLLIVPVILMVMVLFSISKISSYSLAVALVFSFIYVWLAIGVFKYKIFIYRTVLLFCFVLINKMMFSLMLAGEIGGMIIFDVIFVCVIAGLARYLESKLFPSVGLFKIKKDEKGNLL